MSIMDGRRYLLLTLVTVGLFALSGSSCPRAFTLSTPPPRVLPPSPTLPQIVQAVNQNSGQIQSFTTNSATISGPGWPALRCSIAFQRTRLLRLRAETALTGPEVDLGSNEQVFWFWVRHNQPPGVYFCRHDQFTTSRARQMIPIEPDWLIDALGVTLLDPQLPHQGPFPVAGGRSLQIRTILDTAEGPITKVTVIDAASALIMEQHLLDARGQVRASAAAEGHRRDALTGLWMPAAVQVNCPSARFAMKVNLGNVEINRLAANPELWVMPNYPGSPQVDLCDPRLCPAPSTASRPIQVRP
jgi:hypothetical protein